MTHGSWPRRQTRRGPAGICAS